MTAMDVNPTSDADTSPATRPLATAAFGAALAASFGTLTSFYLLLSALPAHLLASGADPLVPGLATGGAMLAGVVTEIAAIGFIARIGPRRTFALGASALGIPALFVLVDGPLPLIACCLVRGLGFGLTVVASGTILMALVPPERRGEGVGIFGFVASAPAIIALPLGVWVVDTAGIGLVGLGAAAAALLAIIPTLWPTAQSEASRSRPRSAGVSDSALGLRQAVRRGTLVRPALVFAASTAAAGVVVTFLPGLSVQLAAAGLLVQALASALSRWFSGRIGDHVGHSRMLLPALLITGGGLTLSLVPDPVALVAGMAFFGIGFGATQTATLSLMADRVPPEGHGAVSALWNLSYDVGYAAGPLAGGAAAAVLGVPAVFGIVAAVVLLAMPLARHDGSIAGRKRSARPAG